MYKIKKYINTLQENNPTFLNAKARDKHGYVSDLQEEVLTFVVTYSTCP